MTLVPNFRLHTTILRMNMADCWIIMGHAMAGRSTSTAVRNTLCPLKNLLVCFLSNCLTLLNLKKSSVPITILMQEDSTGQVSSPMSSKKKNRNHFVPHLLLTDSNGLFHFPVPFLPANQAQMLTLPYGGKSK